MIPPDGGALDDPGVRALRRALVVAGFWFLPEVTGRKSVPKPYSDWRTRTDPFDPDQPYANAYGLLFNTALVTVRLVTLGFDLDWPPDVQAALDLLTKTCGPPRCVRSRPNSPRRAVIYRCDDPEGLYACAKGSDGGIELFSGPYCKLTAAGVRGVHVAQPADRASRPV
jgi:hypothetical protein